MASRLSSCLRWVYMKQKLPTAGLVIQVLNQPEEVLLDGQLSLQLSEEGIHEAKAVHSWG
jgi:hypothetical protein